MYRLPFTLSTLLNGTNLSTLLHFVNIKLTLMTQTINQVSLNPPTSLPFSCHHKALFSGPLFVETFVIIPLPSSCLLKAKNLKKNQNYQIGVNGQNLEKAIKEQVIGAVVQGNSIKRHTVKGFFLSFPFLEIALTCDHFCLKTRHYKEGLLAN